MKNIAIMKPKSPTRLVTNALSDALDARVRSNQNPTSRYEHRPTPSHPRNVRRKLEARTRISIAAANRLKYAKKRANRSSPRM